VVLRIFVFLLGGIGDHLQKEKPVGSFKEGSVEEELPAGSHTVQVVMLGEEVERTAGHHHPEAEEIGDLLEDGLLLGVHQEALVIGEETLLIMTGAGDVLLLSCVMIFKGGSAIGDVCANSVTKGRFAVSFSAVPAIEGALADSITHQGRYAMITQEADAQGEKTVNTPTILKIGLKPSCATTLRGENASVETPVNTCTKAMSRYRNRRQQRRCVWTSQEAGAIAETPASTRTT